MNRNPALATLAAMLALTAGVALVPIGVQASPGRQYPVAQTLSRNIPNIEVQARDVRDVLRELFRSASQSFTIDPSVQGTVTLTLRNVTFETALQNIVRQVDATYRIEGGVISVLPRNLPPDSLVIQPSQNPPNPEPFEILQDRGYLYVFKGSRVAKIRKSDLKVVATSQIPELDR